MRELILIELSLIKMKIEDTRETINEALNTKFIRGRESNQFYDKLETRFIRIKENYFEWNKSVRKSIKKETEEELIKESEKTSEEIKKINESLRKLRQRAETTINYKHLSYEQLKDTYLPNLEEKEFTPTRNVVRFVKAIMETRNSNLTEDILIKIIKKKTNRDVYNKLEIEVLIHNYNLNDIIKFFVKRAGRKSYEISSKNWYLKILVKK